jgi:threonine 3-dehydrogenase
MKGTMKAVRKVRTEPGLDLVDVAIPSIQPDEVLVKVYSTAICGSDIHFYNWDDFAQKKLKPPLTIGHEFSGEVVEAGSAVRGFKVGDYITADSHIVCGRCEVCKMGLQHICQNLKIFGNEVDGSFAQYVAVPETSLWHLSRQVHPDIGGIMEPLGGAVQAVLIEPVTAKSVVIYGDGPMALLAAGVARASGARKVSLIGMVPSRLEIAKRMGADAVYNINDSLDYVQAIKDDTRGVGADVVIEMAGAPASVKNAFDSVRKGGRVTLFGITPKPVELDINFAIILRQVTVRGVAGRHMWETWRLVDGLLASGQLDPSPVITHRLPLDRFDEGFKLLTTGSREGVKIMLHPNGQP